MVWEGCVGGTGGCGVSQDVCLLTSRSAVFAFLWKLVVVVVAGVLPRSKSSPPATGRA